MKFPTLKEIKEKFKFTIEKKLLVSLFLFFIIVAIVFVIDFRLSKTTLITEIENKNKQTTELLIANIKEKILTSSEENINNLLKFFVTTTNIVNIKVTYIDFLFTKENLIRNSNYSKSFTWDVSDVTTDISNGHILIEDKDMYKLVSNDNFNIKNPITFKYFMYKNDTVINSISHMPFYYEVSNDGFSKNSMNIKTEKTTINLDKEPLLDLEYTIDNTYLSKKVSSLYGSHVKYYFIIIILFTLSLALIYFIFIKKMLLNSIKLFKNTMSEALDNKFTHKIEDSVGDELVDDSLALLGKILKKYMIVLNELNINKNILERKVFTDDLTGLPNQKVFELDLKNMFIANSDGFVGTIRLESLGEFTKKFGSALANHLIEEFTNSVQNKFYEYDLQEATLYRFFGSEFAMILKYDTEDTVRAFSESLQEELTEMGMRYEIENKSANFAFIPFDKYGSIDSILHSLSDAYVTAKDSESYFYMVSPSEVLDKFSVIEQNVREIIENDSFEIEYGFETKSLDSNEVLMLEAIPILYDKNKEKFSIGVFVAAAEKIELAVNFDKKIVEAVVNHINTHTFNYGIVVNLSMFTLRDTQFTTWLHSLFLNNKKIAKKIIFSMTSYNASTDIEVFKAFIEEIHRFGAKIIMKRYTTSDFSISELEDIDLDYLRISKDYTTNLSKDRDKKHFIRTIVNLGQSNEIIIIGDSIKDNKDIEACTNIGLDAVSNY